MRRAQYIDGPVNPRKTKSVVTGCHRLHATLDAKECRRGVLRPDRRTGRRRRGRRSSFRQSNRQALVEGAGFEPATPTGCTSGPNPPRDAQILCVSQMSTRRETPARDRNLKEPAGPRTFAVSREPTGATPNRKELGSTEPIECERTARVAEEWQKFGRNLPAFSGVDSMNARESDSPSRSYSPPRCSARRPRAPRGGTRQRLHGRSCAGYQWRRCA
jgi:hypothetical protein